MLYQIALRMFTSLLTLVIEDTVLSGQASGASLFWGGAATSGLELTWPTPCVDDWAASVTVIKV